MQTNQITDLVRDRGDFTSDERAVKATTEVLKILADRDLGGEAENLAAQLPREFGELLAQSGQQAEAFAASEFIMRIQTALELTESEAELTARAVLSSITDGVSPGQRTKFVNALPHDFSGYTRWT